MQEKIEIEKNGKKYVGFYKVDRGYVTVHADLESSTSDVKELEPKAIEAMAKLLLDELINKGKIRPIS